ncbi:MAG: hypothetical protein AB7W59_16785 [Acidimicrobiia bacterium]
MTGTDPNLTMSQPTSFKVGDRVRITADDMFAGLVGVIIAEDHETDPLSYRVRLTGAERAYFYGEELIHIEPMTAPARTLLAAWHASDRTLERVDRPTSANRANINWGRATRRYCTPDLSIDITISTEAL